MRTRSTTPVDRIFPRPGGCSPFRRPPRGCCTFLPDPGAADRNVRPAGVRPPAGAIRPTRSLRKRLRVVRNQESIRPVSRSYWDLLFLSDQAGRAHECTAVAGRLRAPNDSGGLCLGGWFFDGSTQCGDRLQHPTDRLAVVEALNEGVRGAQLLTDRIDAPVTLVVGNR